MYEVLTLKQPFSGTNPLTIAKMIVDNEYEPLPDDTYSPLLLNVVRKCMTADQEYRPSIS